MSDPQFDVLDEAARQFSGPPTPDPAARARELLVALRGNLAVPPGGRTRWSAERVEDVREIERALAALVEQQQTNPAALWLAQREEALERTERSEAQLQEALEAGRHFEERATRLMAQLRERDADVLLLRGALSRIATSGAAHSRVQEIARAALSAGGDTGQADG